MTETIPLFLSQLQTKGKQPKTISTYEIVLRQFAHWMEETAGELFRPEDVTPIDVAEYRRYLDVNLLQMRFVLDDWLPSSVMKH
ncbi:phage integrase N-terminal SAM-like domain-containing protein [Shimazuella alba]|uniref:Core-binding (CB) domain-containing protein n=1 Tax=Shimazuella alba TaxID=2690964 RepID=A0A6I4VTI1_9BACL|nr:phage integrase N-terminal SAM-like domain-containing protein [Shimazuella alba]MXQ53475.1 hypothetical protein [Shimazuella alba]